MATATQHRAGAALPRPLIAIGVPCAGVLLIAIFLIRGFPYDELGQLITGRIEQSHGIRLVVGNIGPALQLAGPALEATQLRATFPGQSPQQIERALVRPAWSLSWFAGEPALHVEVDSPSGRANGTLRWNGVTSWEGTLRDAQPDLPPIADWIPTGGLAGTLDATVDISLGEAGLEGLVEFEIRDGSISLPKFPVPLPFENLKGAVTLGGDAYAKLTSLTFDGPTASGSGTGKIGLAEKMDQAPIGFEFQFKVEPELSGAVRKAGLKTDSEGAGTAKVSGTVAKPKIR